MVKDANLSLKKKCNWRLIRGMALPKLWIMSDLHMENVPYPEAFQPDRPDFDALVAAGDIWEGDCLSAFRFLRNLAEDKPIIFVMGNHEYWNGLLEDGLAMARHLAPRYGVALLDGDSVQIAGCRFIGATLWSDYALARPLVDSDAETGEQIDIAHKGGTHLITPKDAARLHAQARSQLETLVDQADGTSPTIIVTHHAPHPLCLPKAEHGAWRAGNSASDLSYLTDSGRASLWVHGHIHESVDLARPGGTRILCNPAGRDFSNLSFNENFVVEP